MSPAASLKTHCVKVLFEMPSNPCYALSQSMLSFWLVGKKIKIIKWVSFVSSSLYCIPLCGGHRVLNTVFMVNLRRKSLNDWVS